MHIILRYTYTIFLLLLSVSLQAQDYNTYRASEAALLQINENDRLESRLEKVVISLSNNSSLNVRWNIPYRFTSFQSADSTMLSSSFLVCNLAIKVNLWEIQNNLTSAKTYMTQGLLTLNDSAKNVMVEYMVLPSTTAQSNDFSLSMNIQFLPADFNFDGKLINSRFIIKISNGTINRI